MKNLLLTTLFLVIGISASFAQPKSKFVINEVDPFTQQRRLQTQKVLLEEVNRGARSSIYYTVESDTVRFVADFHLTDFDATGNIQGELLLMDDVGDIHTVASTNDIDVDAVTRTSSVHWGFGISSGSNVQTFTITTAFVIDKRFTELILNRDIQYIRIEINDYTFNYKLYKPTLKALRKQIQLVEPYIQ